MFVIAVVFSQEKNAGSLTQAARFGRVFGRENWYALATAPMPRTANIMQVIVAVLWPMYCQECHSFFKTGIYTLEPKKN